MFSYRVTVVVPVYNVEKQIRSCLESLVTQTIDKSEMEVLLINDGSPDRSIDICNEYADKYAFFKVFSKENEGLSKTRNFGINHANGKYIMYLDSDDTLSQNSVKDICDFFDKHYDETDIVTYRIIPIVDGKQGTLHYRYNYLLKSGVYDVTKDENIFISQTNINICVKNLGKDNILFDVTNGFRHEDQKYCIEYVLRKMKIGFCGTAKYLYIKNPDSIVNTYFYAYYIFEKTIKFWEDLFERFNYQVPKYIQALYANDLNWKMKTDILLPYHYDESAFEKAKDRIKNLLNYVDNDVILLHPTINMFHKYYFIGMKTDTHIRLITGTANLALTDNDDLIYTSRNPEIVLTKFTPKSHHVIVEGFLKSPIFSFCDKPDLYLMIDGDADNKISLELTNSNWDYYQTKIRTNKFYRFKICVEYTNYRIFEMQIKINDRIFKPSYFFMPNIIFNYSIPRLTFYRDKKCFSFESGKFIISNEDSQQKRLYEREIETRYLKLAPKVWLSRYLVKKMATKKDRIWLYYDCKNVLKDNGYYQFIHDFEMNDGIKRYYIVNDSIDRSQLFTKKQKKQIVKFGSIKHKLLFLNAEKIMTAFVETNNYIPFFNDVSHHYYDLFHAEVVYLQHGVLHANLPWKYSYDRLTIDREVISTDFEQKNLCKNYNFSNENLIRSCMPRYDYMDITKKPENKILFAPTWRKYLVNQTLDGFFEGVEGKFIKSEFFKETFDFLNSSELADMLEKYDYQLDFKLHPIFSCYSNFYKINNPRVNIVTRNMDESDYKIFITDFSSFIFDFVYLQRSIIYFVPDYNLFKAGLNDYRKLDLPFEDGFGPFCTDSQQALNSLKSILANDGNVDLIFQDRMANFFLYRDNKNCDRLYDYLMEN